MISNDSKAGRGLRQWWASLWLLAVLGLAPDAFSQAISGTVTDALTGLPVAGIDIDLLDDRFRNVASIDALSLVDGSYLLGPIPDGTYYVRADVTTAQGYLDQYHPNVFLPGSATALVISGGASIVGIDFTLERGATLRGVISGADSALPLAGIDLDLYAADLSFLPTVDAVTDIDGSFEIGPVPDGSWFLKADPTAAQGYVLQYYSGADLLFLATPINVLGGVDVAGLNMALGPGGAIFGRLTALDGGLPLADIDLDLFDDLGNLVTHLDALSDIDGSYELLSVPVGSYTLLADPDPLQPYINTWYGGTEDPIAALPIQISKGLTISGVDIALFSARFLRGTVRDQASGLGIAGVDLDVFDVGGNPITTVDALTLADGSYELGPLPSGQYLLRVDPSMAQGYVDQYHPGVFLFSQALPITAIGGSVNGIDFSLQTGGSIGGVITDSVSGLPLAGIDLDVYAWNFEPIPSVDADTVVDGSYELGSLPPGDYYVRADPALSSGYSVSYYAGAADLPTATPITVGQGQLSGGIDIALDPGPPLAGPDPLASVARWSVGAPYPNPFAGRTSILLRASGGESLTASIHDARGRRLQILDHGQLDGERILQWSGRDGAGREVASGIYYLSVQGETSRTTRKLILVR